MPPFGEFIPGHEFSGVVESTGKNVVEYGPEDRVVVEPHKGCGRCINCIRGLYTTCLNYGRNDLGHRHYGFTANGGFAEYAVVHLNTLHKIPDQVTFDDAALLTMAATGLYGIERIGGIWPGEIVTVIGPGPIGLACVQLAKQLGASTVFLLGTRDSRLKIGTEIGADEVINVKENQPQERIMDVTGGVGIDLVVECSGNESGAETALSIVKKSGRICFLGMYKNQVSFDLTKIVQYNLQLAGGRAEGMYSLDRAIRMMASEKLYLNPLITHRFSLDQATVALDTFIKRLGGALKVIIQP
jgi:L-iditol 2-dehydrogenase